MFGKCLCASVKFNISGTPPRIYQCHCSLCRKVSGSSSNSAMLVSSKEFTWLSGQNQIKKYATQSGFKSEFCGACGSPVPNVSSNGEMVWVPAGLLDEPVDTSIALHVYTDSSGSWDIGFLEDSIPTFSEMPDELEFIKLLHGNDS